MNSLILIICSVVSLSFGVGGWLLARQQLFGAPANAALRLLAAAGVVGFVVLNVIAYTSWRREGRRVEELRQIGTPVMAKIETAEQDRSVAVNKQYPYRLVCRWTDPQTKRMQTFRSDRIFHNPAIELRNHSEVRVFVDLANPDNYYVDLESIGIQP